LYKNIAIHATKKDYKYWNTQKELVENVKLRSTFKLYIEEDTIGNVAPDFVINKKYCL